MINPIIKLTKQVQRVEEGNYDGNIEVKSKDEIGILIKEFMQMKDKIKEQIETINSEKEKVEKLEKVRREFFNNVTHELKTPLTTIMGYAQIIKENGFSDRDFFEKGISYIIDESKRLNNMVVEILDLSTLSSRDAAYNFEKLDISRLVSSTCDEMGIKGKKYNIDLRCSAEQGLFVKGDIDKIKEVLVNLIDNSIKYGSVNSVINVDAYSEGKNIYIKVRDKGKGIPEEHLHNLFEPFYRVSKRDSREKGSAGLGLSIVKNIVEKHNGTIVINSRVNEGTEVIIRFGRWFRE
jgi:signal transduction histidine kinase